MNITLPWPAKELSPNYHGPRRPQWGAEAAAKYDSYYAALEGLQHLDHGKEFYHGHALRLLVTFHPPNNRLRDRDNAQASLKHQFDGIAQALGVNDSCFQPMYVWGEVRRGGSVEVLLAIAAEEVPNAP